MIGSRLLQLFSYRDRVIVKVISLMLGTIIYIQSLTAVMIDLVIGDLDERTDYWCIGLVVYCIGLA